MYPHQRSYQQPNRRLEAPVPKAIAISSTQVESAQVESSMLIRGAIALLTLGAALGLALPAIANPVTPVATITTAAAPEIDTSITREYEPATVYLPDPVTQELVPQSVLVDAEEPVAGAVDQILQNYEGQDIGITGYDVVVDATANEAEVSFDIEHPRGAAAFQSLSSANQYSLFEAIRETLLTEPMYDVEEVIFTANGTAFDI